MLILLIAGIFALPSSAGAASTTYPGSNQSTFTNTAAGWQSSSDYAGLCIQGVTCPTVAGEFVASGGAGGSNDGFIRTTSGATTVAALLSTSTQTWRSPQFIYRGINGEIPADLTFDMSKRSGFQSLLALGADAEFSVTALNQSSGPDVPLITARTVGNADVWQSIPESSVVPGSLQVGDTYVLEIRTSVGGLAAVLPSGAVDYDNVTLVASDKNGPGGGGNGGGGTGGGGNGDGAVLPPPKVIPAGVAYLYKNRLFVRVKCPKRFKPKCRVKGVALTRKKRGKAMTKPFRAGVKTKRFVRKGLQIKPKFRAKVRRLAKVKRKTLVLRLNIKSKRGKKKGTVYHRLRVIERRK